MSHIAQIVIHESQFPDAVRRDLLESLRTRQLNHKFLYDSVRQTQRWLALHQAFSPSRQDSDVAKTYARAFAAAAERISDPRVHLIGLGCGGGQKDTRLLQLLKSAGKQVAYTPSDVSTAMVLVAKQTALAEVPAERCFPLVVDLASTPDVAALLENHGSHDGTRLISFFGMIPNFEPELILPKLAALVRPGDWLLFSANLAPGPEYAAGVERILPQYDNELTREWLLGFLLDLGVNRDDGAVHFRIHDAAPLAPATKAPRLKRIEASFHFTRTRSIQFEGSEFTFAAGESFRLFFSYRYTPDLIRNLLEFYGLQVVESCVATSEEEGVFLVTRR